MCQSRTLLVTDNNEMDLINRTLFLELSFGIGTVLDIFQSVDSMDKLKSEVSEGAISSAKVFNIHEEMPSGPVAE